MKAIISRQTKCRPSSIVISPITPRAKHFLRSRSPDNWQRCCVPEARPLISVKPSLRDKKPWTGKMAFRDTYRRIRNGEAILSATTRSRRWCQR